MSEHPSTDGDGLIRLSLETASITLADKNVLQYPILTAPGENPTLFQPRGCSFAFEWYNTAAVQQDLDVGV